jgi:hypothetical protein
MIIQRLHVLDINNQDVTWLRSLDLKGTSEVVNLRQVDILDIICIVRVLDLTTSPIDAFNLDRLAILDGASEGDYFVSKYT